MELRQLRYFVAIAEVENFRRAGERLKISQPALSTQIGLLEKEIGTKLFDRLPRGIRVSEAGRSFLNDAKAILAKLDEARERAHSIGTGLTGPLRISFSEVTSAHGVLVESIRTFRALEPQVKMLLSPMPSRSQKTALKNGQLDACFLYMTPENRAEFAYLQLRMDHVFAAIPSSHRLAAARDVGIADFSGEPMIWMQPGNSPRLHDGLRTAFDRAGLTPHIIQEAASVAQMLTLVSLGLGLGLACYADWWQTPAGIVLRPVRDIDLSFPFDLAWRKDNESPALASFVRIARDIAARERTTTKASA
jgi:DNA-binding transcriptional LysR family regulator